MLACAVQVCFAQTTATELLATSSGYSSDATASLSWTVGEPLIETGSSVNNFLTQGFQQPHSLVISSIDNITNETRATIAAYPNPGTSTVYISSSGNEPLMLDVMDLTGRKLFSMNLIGKNDNEVNMADYAAGKYFLFLFIAL